ncbi:MAG: holin [Clostridia bacterium]|nr:holin [Clostridia bacterium]MBQ2274593.1 holin [Clostridia bacterium]MBQ5900710.1 holin [Clostridia bacterium]MEE1278894.1 phage holin family protein [Acutalibacteraceae bacterium]
MDFLQDYIVLMVLGICLCVGYIIKNLVPNDKINRFIPLIMGVLGIALNVWLERTLTPKTVLGGLVSGLASTGFYEMFKHFITKK